MIFVYMTKGNYSNQCKMYIVLAKVNPEARPHWNSVSASERLCMTLICHVFLYFRNNNIYPWNLMEEIGVYAKCLKYFLTHSNNPINIVDVIIIVIINDKTWVRNENKLSSVT